MDAFHAIREAYHRILPMTDPEWAAFARLLELKHFSKGDFLIRAGQVGNHIHFLNKGATRNYFLKDGKEFTVDFHFAGDFVGAYFSFITREPSPVFIESLEVTETVSIAYDPLQEFYRQSHQGERIGRLMAEFQYVKRLKKEMDILSLTAEERYKELLHSHPDLVSSLSVKHLSSYLGIQPESLSRIRKASFRN